MKYSRNTNLFVILLLVTGVVFLAMLSFGQVQIPLSEVWSILTCGEVESEAWRTIVIESRLPMAVTSLLAGIALAGSGLLLQTTFRNPLAGPSILGISSGASLGVACVMLAFSSMPSFESSLRETGAFAGALLGAGIIMIILSMFSALLRNNLSLLIVGIMISYLASAIISILNTLAPAEAVRSFVIWGLGSYAGVTMQDLPLFAAFVLLPAIGCLFLSKPLNASLLGDRYLNTMGYNVTLLRTLVLTVASILAAVVTAWCGPIGFIGLIVPHIARMIFDTSNHFVLLPATLLMGGIVSLACAFVSVLPISDGVLPINAVTPVAGVPVIIYIMLNTKKLKYFN